MARPYTREYIALRRLMVCDSPEEIEDKFQPVLGPTGAAAAACVAAGMKRAIETQLQEGRDCLDNVKYLVVPNRPSSCRGESTLLVADIKAQIGEPVYSTSGPETNMGGTQILVFYPRAQVTGHLRRYASCTESERAFFTARNDAAQSRIGAGHPAAGRLRSYFNIG